MATVYTTKESVILLLLLLGLTKLTTTNKATTCGFPTYIDHSDSDPNRAFFNPGQKVVYTCQSGYKQAANTTNTVECGSDGEWNTTSFNCVPVTCPALSNPDNGAVEMVFPGWNYMSDESSNPYEFGSIHRYTCNEGFVGKDKPKVEVTCYDDGVWSEIICDDLQCTVFHSAKPEDSPPTSLECVPVTCPALSNPDNGSVVMVQQATGKYNSDYIYHSVYRYTCSEGFVSNGSTEVDVTCLADGTWSDIICYDEACTLNRTAVNPNGGRLPLSDVQGPIPLTNREEFKCSAVRCDEPPTIANADYDNTGPDQFLYGGSGVTYVCDEGYTINGVKQMVVKCLKSRKWSAENVTCEPATCEAPLTPASSTLTSEGDGKLIAGSTRVYKCDAGTAVKGSDRTSITLECQSNGTWTWTSI